MISATKKHKVNPAYHKLDFERWSVIGGNVERFLPDNIKISVLNSFSNIHFIDQKSTSSVMFHYIPSYNTADAVTIEG